MSANEHLLEINEINSFYGKTQILRNVSFEISKNEVCCLLGRNGMGKTTTLKSIMGIIEPKSGEIIFEGEKITQKPIWDRPKMGISYVAQERALFSNMTVLENMKVSKLGDLTEKDLEWIYDLFPNLEERESQKAGNLSGGERQMLTISKALVNKPKLILLDEPSEGLQPSLVKGMEVTIKEIREEGVSVLLVEQNVPLCNNVGDRFLFMENGEIKGEMSEKIDEKTELVKKYIGVSA